MKRITLFGMITRDFQKPEEFELGGSPVFFAHVAKRFPVQFRVFSSIGKTDIHKLPSCVPQEELVIKDNTTEVHLDAQEGQIKALVRHFSKISPREIPQVDLLVVSTLVDEIDIKHLIKRKGHSLLAVDLQGFTRKSRGSEFVLAERIKRLNDRFFDIIRSVDILKCNELESRLLCDEEDLEMRLRKIQEMGPKIIIITCGADGAVLLGKDFITVHSHPISCKNTLGAGDTLFASFLCDFLIGNDEQRALHNAMRDVERFLEGKS